ncbi:MAG: four helix bundle protein [Bacteroidota bacterium]|nr:four helix bundle protein [Bacteroidota bacterium]
MSKIEKFEDLKVWKDSMRLATEIYKQMKDSRDYGYRDQIQRASVSIPSNIAEGYERQSNKEFIQFLFIAKGSCGELRTQIYLGIELELIDKEKRKQMLRQTREISAMLYGLIQTRKRNF